MPNNYCIVIRGPAGVGKSTISKIIAKELSAKYISIDKVLADLKLDKVVGDGIPAKNFLVANKEISSLVNTELGKNKSVVIDGCFYRISQITDLKKRFSKNLHVFTLIASQKTCLIRNKTRKNPMPDSAIIDVYRLVSKFNVGHRISVESKSAKAAVRAVEESSFRALPILPISKAW